MNNNDTKTNTHDSILEQCAEFAVQRCEMEIKDLQRQPNQSTWKLRQLRTQLRIWSELRDYKRNPVFPALKDVAEGTPPPLYATREQTVNRVPITPPPRTVVP